MTQFFTSFCTGLILIGSLYIICPDGNISKSVKYIFTLVFLILIISAANILPTKIDFDFKTPPIETETSQDMQIYAIKYLYSNSLERANINFKEIYVYTDNSDDQSIVITKVIIVSNENSEKIINALGELAEYRKVEIINE